MTKRFLPLLLVLAVGAVSAATSTAAVSPTRAIAQAKAELLKDMWASAKSGDRSAKFPSPSRAVLMQRLHKAEKLYGFRVVSVQMLHPLQSAPTTANPGGYSYEGYFFVAQTSRGLPYLATFHHWRVPHVGGSRWAASESLYPFAHG